MQNIADKFKAIGKSPQSGRSSSSIFGDTNLTRAIVSQTTRISLYPIISKKSPELAMGIACCLTYLIEQYNNIKVYQVIARIDDSDDDTEVGSDDYQFNPEEWEFEGLDDNIIITGELSEDFTIHIHIDMNLVQEGKEIDLSFEFEDLNTTILNLPVIARGIIEEIVDSPPTELIITYPDDKKLETQTLNTVLENTFYWNLDLYLYLWGVEWPDDEITEQFDDMITLCESTQSQFVTWCLSMMAKQVMQIGLDVIGDVIIPQISKVSECDSRKDISTSALSTSLANLGYVTQAVNMIESAARDEKTSSQLWFSIINVYLKANQFNKAVDSNQQALELRNADYRLYWMYHQLLNTAEANDIFIEELVLIDPDDIQEDEQVTYEVIEALKVCFQHNPDNITILYTLLKYLIDVEHDELWEHFRKLLEANAAFPVVRDIIERFYDLYDLAQAFEILEEFQKLNTQSSSALVYQAQLELLDGHAETAKELLNQASKLLEENNGDVNDADLQVEIPRLLLVATFEGFESKYSDILIMLDAGKAIPEQSVELLESALEVAPQFADIYVALARCYLQWNDIDGASEVISEAIQTIGNHPRVDQVNSQIHWKKGDQQKALETLNYAIDDAPNDVLLLSQMAQFLIENRQLDDSKRYIERAEVIAPSHPEIWKLRKLIADQVD